MRRQDRTDFIQIAQMVSARVDSEMTGIKEAYNMYIQKHIYSMGQKDLFPETLDSFMYRKDE